jgi:hypothetical protein
MLTNNIVTIPAHRLPRGAVNFLTRQGILGGWGHAARMSNSSFLSVDREAFKSSQLLKSLFKAFYGFKMSFFFCLPPTADTS